ncbi:MAG: DNA primase, partial [Dysgonamonadaceae bacterium]|nr:DNA primase [Dysgonamonadaceae bacterium]
MIEQRVIDKVFDAANIVEVVGDYVSLKKRGINYIGLCPFHEDHQPSFYVSPSKNICKCFSCGKGGNPVNFLMEQEGITYPEAIRSLAGRYNIEIENLQLSPEEKEKQQERESMRSILNFSQKLFEQNLSDSTEALEYLSERHIFPGTYKKFGVGLALSDQLFRTLVDKRFSPEIALTAGMLRRDELKCFRDYFFDRITFPYYDLYGNITGFTARTLTDSNIKYLNTPDTELFNKGNVLFGLFQAKKAIQKSDTVYITEGQFDVLAMVQAGLENTVCGSGTALTSAQIKLIKRFTQNVTLVYDGDAAGIKATLKNGESLLAAGINVHVVILPAGEDPDSYLRKNNDTSLFTNKKHLLDFISWKYEYLRSENPDADPIQTTRIYKSIAETISMVPDEIFRKNYITHLATKYKADGELIKDSVREYLSGKQDRQKPKEPGFYGLKEAKELISDQKKAILLTGNIDKFVEHFGEEPVIYYFGAINYSHIQELIHISTQIEFIDTVSGPIDKDSLEETPQLHFLKNLHKSGFNIILSDTCDECDEKNSKNYGFLDFYIISCSQLAKYYETNNKNRSIMVDRAAEMLSYVSDAERNAGIKQYCKYFDITSKAMNDTLKSHLEKKKSKYKFQSENLNIEGETLNIDPNKIPDYVDHQFLNRYEFFPLQSPSGRKIAYMFRNNSGSFTLVGNFYIEPLFHVYNKESGANKRIVRLNHMELKNPIIVEWPSKDMINLGTFRQMVWEEGPFVFSNGTAFHLDKIIKSIATGFPRCTELNIYGQQKENFFAFSNAIYHIVDGVHKIHYVDEFGIVAHEDVNYYAPAFSKIYAGERGDNDRFSQDRYFVYKELPEELRTDFATWASLMDTVYKQNNNGKWALLFTIMSAFRSVIYPIDRLFTSPFFVGPTESGKSQIAVSIRSLFIHPDAALFNLNTGSDAAFSTLMERYRDVPI